MVRLRLNWAVKPFAAHSATPNEPLPSGRNCVAELLGRPSTTSERDTTQPTSRMNEQFCQAVVAAAGAAWPAEPMATVRTGPRETTANAAVNRRGFQRLVTIPP